MTLAMFGLTIALGVWQIQRLHWKEGLLAEIDRAEGTAPAPLPAAPRPFEKVEVTGRMRDDLVAYYGSEVRSTLTGPMLGAQVLTLLERPGEEPILVDRGWMPEGATPKPDGGPVLVVGYVRPAERASWLAPKADLAAHRFWSLDPAAIGAALDLKQVAPFTLVALGPGGTMPPYPAQALPRPPNNHLGYAITWFGLAACSLGVFATYAWKVLRA